MKSIDYKESFAVASGFYLLLAGYFFIAVKNVDSP
jgi:hypothetical protein